MTRPSRSLNWYEPGASGIEPAGGRCSITAEDTEVVWPGDARATLLHCPAIRCRCRPGIRRHIRFRGRHPRGRGDRAVPAVQQPELPTWRTPDMLRLQTPLDERYTGRSESELAARIEAAKAALGERVFILGHHYQRDEVIRWVDARGDSYRLSVLAQEHPEAEYIVFCGVHFMAESADILSADHQQVILPDLTAGCTMADMAETDQVDECWDHVTSVIGDDVLPVTYMNSTAALKAFVGRNGGAVCTSSNARAVLEWAFRQKPRVLFFPDQHLGRNTGYRMGIPLEAMALWDPYEDQGGL